MYVCLFLTCGIIVLFLSLCCFLLDRFFNHSKCFSSSDFSSLLGFTFGLTLFRLLTLAFLNRQTILKCASHWECKKCRVIMLWLMTSLLGIIHKLRKANGEGFFLRCYVKATRLLTGVRFGASVSNSSRSSLKDPGFNPAWGRLYGNYYAHT